MRIAFVLFLALPFVTQDELFRASVPRIVAVRNFENKTHTWTISLYVSWDAGVKPLFINAQPDGLVVRVGDNSELKPISQGIGRLAIANANGLDMSIRVEAPPHPTEKIALLKGDYTIVGSKRTLSFTFDPAKPGPQSQTQDGVTAALHEFKQTKSMWTIRVRLIYPDDTPDFESFESWLGNNEIVLERKDGKGRFTPNGGYSIDDASGKSAILTYRFTENEKLRLGKPSDWRIVYRTPGKIENMTARFEFKDLRAP